MSSNKNKSGGANWLHEKLSPFMGPALLVLIGSSIFRGLLGIAIASLTGAFGTYSHWSPWFRLPVEIIVFLGVFISGDICYANGVGNVETMKKKKLEILNEEQPKLKGTADQQVAQHDAYLKNRNERTSYINEEIKTERQARNVFGFISASYALNFIVQSAIVFNDFWQMLVILTIDAMSVFATFFVIWYYAARFKAEKNDPEETGVSLMETAMEKRLEKVSGNFETGEPTEADLNLAEAALPAKHPYKKFIPALRKMPDANEVMTTKDIFVALGIDDQTDQRAVRRAIKVAFDNHVPGVFHIQNGSKQEWRISGEAFYKVLAKFLPGGQNTDRPRTYSGRQRPSRNRSTGQAPDTDRPSNEGSDGTGTPEGTPSDGPVTDVDLTGTLPGTSSGAPGDAQGAPGGNQGPDDEVSAPAEEPVAVGAGS